MAGLKTLESIIPELSPDPMRILLLSAYDAMSHIYWRKGLVDAFPEHDWTVLTLPARYFNWRLRGNSLSWAYGERETLESGYDLLICTSMTDLSALKGMVPALAHVPALCYFHENQFAYPASQQQKMSVEPLMLNLYTALAADQVLFNTAYNRETFINGAKALLKKLPDFVPPDLVSLLRKKSAVLPVPLPDEVFVGSDKDKNNETSPIKLEILWNHRWEYDKAPERFFSAIGMLRETGVEFTLHVVGQSFRRVPEVFEAAKQEFADVIGCWGYVESKDEYRSLLKQSDVVVSSAIHDFQGIAVLEGVAAGCVPVVPDRLAYNELFPGRCRYESQIDDKEREAKALTAMLVKLAHKKKEGNFPPAPSVLGLGWSSLKPSYKSWLDQSWPGS